MAPKLTKDRPPFRSQYESEAEFKKAKAKWQERYGSKKVGDLNWNGRKRWNGRTWEAVNVVRHGQRAKLKGIDVYADGKGNWRKLHGVDNKGRNHGEVIGTYEVGKDRKDIKAKTGDAPKPPARKPRLSNIPSGEGPVNNPDYSSKGSAYRDSSATPKTKEKVEKAVKGDDAKPSQPQESSRSAAAPSTVRSQIRARQEAAPRSTPQAAPRANEQSSSTKSAAHNFKDHGSDLHVGRFKTLREHRAAVAARKSGKSAPQPAEKKPTSRQITSANPPATGEAASSKLSDFLKKRKQSTY